VVVDAAVIVAIVIISIVVSILVAFRSRNKPLEAKGRFDWVPPSCVVAGAIVVFMWLMVWSAYAEFLYFLFFAPIIFLTCLVLLVAAAIQRRPRQCLLMLLTLVAFSGASWALSKNEGTLRPSMRWLLWSHRFKAEVLAQPAPVNGELRHMEWEATGFAGVANETVYLVFDPTDSLSVAANLRATAPDGSAAYLAKCLVYSA
jgi:hypothetical protein